MLAKPEQIVERLKEFQSEVRRRLSAARGLGSMHTVARESSADTIYAIDALVDPLLDDFCRDWARTTPLVLIAEGLEPHGKKVFPEGSAETDAVLRVIVDPIDGTRGIMYDKRAAWSLAGVAPNRGAATRLQDIEVAVMTELPTTKMGWADQLWAIKGRGALGQRIDLATGGHSPLPLHPSTAANLEHGFASIVSFFPGTKVPAARLLERITQRLLGKIDIDRACVFDDQYISTGGQFYEMIIGHDRFIADLRPLFYRMQNQGDGLCCHPYDCATLLIAQEAGVIITDGLGQALDGPLDVTTALSWAAYANHALQQQIEPILIEFFGNLG